MTDAYRSTSNTCPSCAAPLREFAKRLVCDQCGGILIGTKDFTAACEDVAGIDLALEISDDDAATETPCPRCAAPLVNAKVTLGDKKLKARFLHCERDGLWCAPGVLTGVFAIVGRTFGGHGAPSHGAGAKGLDGLPVPQHGPASGGLAISRWHQRPRRRPPTVTPVNVYREQVLTCPACPPAAPSELQFAGDRWSCTSCRGAYVERGALEALVEEMASQPFQLAAPSGEVGTRACPVCTEPMIVEKLGASTTIDRCAKHGVWFDEHELQTALVEVGLPEKTGLVGWLKQLF